jgi:tRNA(fMet)-specific endonuclease VapC
VGLVLDTNVFVCFERSDEPIDYSRWEEYGAAYISSITVSELLVGVHYADSEQRRIRRSAYVEAIISTISVLDFNTGVARLHSSLFATLAKEGRMIGAHDLIVAATALANGCAVLTDNLHEFERVPGLTVVPFAKPPRK